jgi:hypothetical protein
LQGDGHRGEAVTEAGAMHAFTRPGQEQGPVQGALDQLAVDVEELPR